LMPSSSRLNELYTSAPWLWNIINNVPWLHDMAMRFVYTSRGDAVYSPPLYNTGFDYVTTESHFNASYYARSLPPVPLSCPTPMGVVGPKELPDVDDLIERFFVRREFKVNPHGTNVFFAFYAQHFSHQFFRTEREKGPGFYAGKDGVDVSNIYGLEPGRQRALRSLEDGKMKVRIVNGEQMPPLLSDVPIPMMYPQDFPEEEKVALGHPFFSMLPGLLVMETMWIREHNRVCDILVQQHPEWDDERLYQTAKLIVLGECLKITIEDYVGHLSQYNLRLTYEPHLLAGQKFQWYNRIHIEFAHLYHWHPLIPNTMTIANQTYSMEQLLYNNQPVYEHGITAFVDAMVNTPAGAIYYGNHGPSTLPVLRQVILQGRAMRMQGLNNYRYEFGLDKYTDFMDMTGDAILAKQLEQLYGHVDAVEWYTGMMFEKPGGSVTPTSTVAIGGPYAVKGMMANPISSPHYWKPSTFGGEIGFDIVKSASIEKLFCLNMKPGECRNIAFTVPKRSASKEEL